MMLVKILFVSFIFIPNLVFGAYEISDGSVVGLWHLNGDAVDSSGNGHNGTNSNVTFSASPYTELDQYGSWNGSNAKITIPDDDAWTFSGDFTIGFYLKQASTYTSCSWPNCPIWVSHDTGGGSNPKWIWGYRFDSGSNLFNFRNSQSNYFAWGQYDTLQSDWNLVVLTREGNTFTRYVQNSSTLDVASSSQAVTIEAVEVALSFGEAEGAFGSAKDMDEIFILNKALSQEEVISIWNSGNPQEICVITDCGIIANDMEELIQWTTWLIQFVIILIIIVGTYLFLKA